MLEVWLMRHGEAADPDRSTADADRALTERGRQQVGAAARWLCERAGAPQLVLHSSLRRAQETAEAFAEGVDGVPIMREAALGPGMRAAALLSVLQQQGLERVVCIGHQPDIGRCLTEWIGGGRFQVAPGMLAVIAFADTPAVGGGSLRAMLDPAWFG